MRRVVLFAMFAFLAGPAFSADFMSASSIKERLEETLELQVGIRSTSKPGKNVGAVVAIYSKGKEEYIFLGEVIKGSGIRPTKETMFEIGTMTKPITGLLLANAIKSGLLKESDRLDSMRPEWKGQKSSDITLKQLADHTSGMPDVPCNMNDLPFAFYEYSEKDLIRGLQDSNPAFEKDCNFNENNPTSTGHYSNWGYGLLGYLITSKSRSTFQALVQGLGLSHTGVVLTEAQKRLMATGYTKDGREERTHERKILLGSSSVKSNAEDMLAFGKTYLKGGENHYKIPYGWTVTKDGHLFKEGESFGYSSYIGVYPDLDQVVLYLTNTARALECFWQAVEKRSCQVEAAIGRGLWL